MCKISPEFEFGGHRPHFWVPTPKKVAVLPSQYAKNQQTDVGVAGVAVNK